MSCITLLVQMMVGDELGWTVLLKTKIGDKYKSNASIPSSYFPYIHFVKIYTCRRGGGGGMFFF